TLAGFENRDSTGSRRVTEGGRLLPLRCENRSTQHNPRYLRTSGGSATTPIPFHSYSPRFFPGTSLVSVGWGSANIWTRCCLPLAASTLRGLRCHNDKHWRAKGNAKRTRL